MLRNQSRQESDPAIRIEWDNIAGAYRRLAEQADRGKTPAAPPAYQPYGPAQPQQVAHFKLTDAPR